MTGSLSYAITATDYKGGKISTTREYKECLQLHQFLTETFAAKYIMCPFPLESKTDLLKDFSEPLATYLNFICASADFYHKDVKNFLQT